MSLGLFSRADIIEFPTWVSLYLGDFLWALMVFWLICTFRPSMCPRQVFVIACLFCFSVELSQLYQADWLNSIRQTWLGALVLGFGFKFSDLVAYLLGNAFGASIRYWREFYRFEIASSHSLSNELCSNERTSQSTHSINVY